MQIHFSDYFNISSSVIDDYGAFNVSLINDLPLFIDPFLLFNSRDPVYRRLHDEIINYLRFLRDKALEGLVSEGLLRSWYMFSEVRQTWLGFSATGNKGSGLGIDFARALHENLNTIFSNFGNEQVTRGSHLEKVCLIREKVGKDNISDFTTNLIKSYLLEYTQTFGRDFLRPEQRKRYRVERVRFNYETETWERDDFELPTFRNDYVLLTPKDILTKDDTWINRHDLLSSYDEVATAIPNEQLRDQINNYLRQQLPKKPKESEYKAAVSNVFKRFPELLEHYIRLKEDKGDEAEKLSDLRVRETEYLFVKQLAKFADLLDQETSFYDIGNDTRDEARQRIEFLKNVIENKDGYRLFYIKGEPVRREKDLQILFRLTWFATPSDVSREANEGRGPVDFKISRGATDKSLVEFKLASNTHLRKNLVNQVPIYEKAHDTQKSLTVIVYFTESELRKVAAILRELNLVDNQDIILIDARKDNKPSASTADSNA